MKKAFAFLLSVCCIIAFAIPAFAATADNILTYGLSSDGNNEISVNHGDIIIVTYTITASERSSTSTTQNQICYDANFFELIPDSIIKESKYEDAFATSNPVDSDGTHYVYFNSVSSVTFAKDTPAKIGSFKLKVIGEGGSSAITNTAFFATDNEVKAFGSNKQDLMVNIAGSSKHVHSGEKQNGVASDEFSAGYKDYYKCSCNKLFADEKCTKEITDIVAWKAPGGEGYIAPEHKHGQAVKKKGVPGKEDEAGYKDFYECSCGAYYEDADCKTPIEDINVWKSKGGNGYIAPINENKVSPVIWIVIGVVVAGGIVVAIIFIKKKEINLKDLFSNIKNLFRRK